MRLEIRSQLDQMDKDAYQANLRHIRQLLKNATKDTSATLVKYFNRVLSACSQGHYPDLDAAHWQQLQLPSTIQVADGKLKINSSHEQTYWNIKSALEFDPSQKLVLIMCDQHLDFYLTGAHPVDTSEMGDYGSLRDQLQQISKSDNPELYQQITDKLGWISANFRGSRGKSFAVAKYNFISALLEWGMIGGVVIIGSHIDWLPISEQSEGTQRFYRRHQDRIKLLEGIPSQDKIAAALNQIARSSQLADGIPVNSTYFTVDVDSLRSGGMSYTPMEYTGVNPKLVLSILNLTEANSLEEAAKILENYKHTGAINIDLHHDGSLPASAIKSSIASAVHWTRSQDMQLGLRTQEDILYGDFTELRGLDYKGRTARIVRALTKSFEPILG